MLIVVLLIIALTIADHCHGKVNDKSPVGEQHRNQLIPSFPSFTFPKRRDDISQALIDPYSVLGVLSFGVYIFYILYARYRMGMGNQQNPMGGGAPGPAVGIGNGDGAGPAMAAPPPAAPGIFNAGTEQNLAYLLDVASKILSKVGEDSFNSNSTLLASLDYYEDATDLQASSE